MSPNAGGGCGVVQLCSVCAHEAQINFGDLTPYLTYGSFPVSSFPHSDICKEVLIGPTFLPLRYSYLALMVPELSSTRYSLLPVD
jgi:hypothetical protein